MKSDRLRTPFLALLSVYLLVSLWNIVRTPLVAVHGAGRPIPDISWQLLPQAAPTSSTSLNVLDSSIPATTDVYVCRMDVTAAAANIGAVTLTIKDGNAIALWDTIPVQPGQWVPVVASGGADGCLWMPKGMTLQASGSGLNIRISGRR